MIHPLVSIVVPTCDRPLLLQHALQSITRQTYTNFEVIVCDNYTSQPARAVFDRFADSRFQYLRPESPLPMGENWELGVRHARGAYVGILIDKTFLLDNALERAVSALEHNPADFLSWGNGAFLPEDETFRTSATGRIVINEPDGSPYFFDLRAELHRRCDFANRLEDEGVRWTWAKICFGLFSRALLTKIHDTYGRYFCGIVPDHDSAIAALTLGSKGLYLNQTGQISILTTIGTGLTSKSDSSVMRRYIETVDPTFDIIHDYPIPRVWSSPHNGTAYSYSLALKPFPEYRLNLRNLIQRTSEDLQHVALWSSLEERISQYRALWTAEADLGVWKCENGKYHY